MFISWPVFSKEVTIFIHGSCAPNSEEQFARQLLLHGTACTESNVDGDIICIDHLPAFVCDMILLHVAIQAK